MNTKQRIIYWLLRLPFSSSFGLASLSGRSEREVDWTLIELQKLGWVESVSSALPGYEEEVLYIVSSACIERLTESSGQQDLSHFFPIGWKDEIRRLSSLHHTVTINRILTMLEDEIWQDSYLELNDLRRLPENAPPKGKWWPPGVDAHISVQHTNHTLAPFFLVQDRTGAPRFHRQKRVAGWYDFWDGDQPWGRDRLPTIVITCERRVELEQWIEAVQASADRRLSPLLSVSVALIDDINRSGALGTIWWEPGKSRPQTFTTSLNWWRSIPDTVWTPPIVIPGKPESLPKSAESLRGWANRIVSKPSPTNTRIADEIAAIALITSTVEKEVVTWLGHHPLLSARDLSVILELPGESVSRIIGRLHDYDVIDSAERPLDGHKYYYLTELGLRFKAAEYLVPYRRFALHGNVVAKFDDASGLGRMRPLLRQFEHTIGINRFFVQLITDARILGQQIIRWLNEPEARIWFGKANAST